MITCLACRSSAVSDAKFCRICGASLATPAFQALQEPPPLPTSGNQTVGKRAATALLVINVLLFIALNIVALFVIPVFGAMFADFGARLPTSIQLLLDLGSVWKKGWWCVAIVAAALGPGVLKASRHEDLRTWLAVGIIVQVLILAFIAFSLFLPIFQLGAVAEGLK